MKTTVEARPSGIVGWDYLRMHDPEMVVRMLRDVRAGKLAKERLDGLASPKRIDQLLGKKIEEPITGLRASRERIAAEIKLPAAAKKPIETAPAGDAKRLAKPDWMKRLGKTGSSGWNAVLDQVRLIAPEVSPASLLLSPVYDGQTSRAGVELVSNTDGPLTAVLPEGSPFKVRAIYAYDGTFEEPAASSRRGNVARPVALKRRIAAQRTSPPWTLDVLAGQSVRVVVAFEPKFDIVSFGAGWKESELRIDGEHWNQDQPKQLPWKVKVPVKGKFLGTQIDLLVFAENHVPDLVKPPSYDPDLDEVFHVVAKVISTNEARSGTFKPESLPPGVSMSNVPMSVGPNQTKEFRLAFRIDRQQGIWLQPNGVTHPMKVRLDYGGKSQTLLLGVTLHPGYRRWYFGGECGSVSFSGNFYLGSSGKFLFSAAGYNDHLVNWYTIIFDGSFDGVRYVNAAKTVDPNEGYSLSYGFRIAAFERDYLDFIKKPFVLEVETD